MSRDKIIDRVRKLLALAKSSNEHEAALAAAHAQKLLSEHNLAMSELEVKEAGAGKEMFDLGRKTLDKWVFQLASVVASAFDCRVVATSGGDGTAKVSFIGCGEDPAVSGYTFQYLVKEMERLVKSFLALVDAGDRAVHRRSWLLGAVRGVQEQLRKQKIDTPVTTTALVPVKDALIRTYIEEHFNKAKVRRTRRSSIYGSSYNAGKETGKSMAIRRGVSGSPVAGAAISTGSAAKCTCCERGDEYNGFGSDGPTIFTCPKSCTCHD